MLACLGLCTAAGSWGCDYFPGELLRADAATENDLIIADLRHDGPALDGPALDGPPLDGPALDGSAMDGPQLDGPPLDQQVADAAPPDQSPPPPDQATPDKSPTPDKGTPDTTPSTDGPGTLLFSDGFEGGTLSKWTTSGPGKPWVITSGASAAGSKAAQAQATGAGLDSFISASFSAPSGGTLTLAYQRRLVGLDGIDDFAAEVHLASSWLPMEHLGAATANDAAFVARSFTIPSGADGVRFKCTCGATSERCLVDEVRITHKP